MKKIVQSVCFALLILTNLSAQQFSISYTSTAFTGSFTGNVVVFLSKENHHPKDVSASLDNFTCFTIAVKNIQPGQTVIVNDKAISFPTTLSNIERGNYYIQAVWDRNLGGRAICTSPGNMFNPTQKIIINKNTNATFKIVCDSVIPIVPAFKESAFDKELKVPSALLTTFHKKSITVDAAIILPAEYYKEPEKKFPVMFIVSGYGGDYHGFSGDTLPSDALDSIPCIWIYLDGNCPLGHSVYANSDNNGPWGDALTQEFIPALENKYRCNGARLLTGHSSGGWTVLWLQTHYPKVFAGCTSSSPDYVDFRSFAQIDLYAQKNLFYGKDSTLNPVGTIAGFLPWLYMKNSYQIENVVYRGEQMHSFDAVFSKKAADGNPERICNPVTGNVNANTFANWQKFDISLYLRTNWDAIKADLDGKVRVSVGNGDNFLLNHPVKLLEKEMKKLNANFKFAYYPGDHFTVSTRDYQKDKIAFLKQKYLEWLIKTGTKIN